MNAKKLFTTLACGLFFTVGATSANAALLQDWEYSYGDVWFTPADTASSGWSSGNYWNEMGYAPIDPNKVSGTMQFDADASNGTNYNGSASPEGFFDSFIQSTEFEETGVMGPELLGTLSFSYSANSVGDEVSFLVSNYSIPLYAYSDGTNSYVYYNSDDTSKTGGGSQTLDGYEYGITGMGLFVDGNSLNIDGQGNSYWIINEETRAHIFDDYVLGGENTILGDKVLVDNASLFNISGSFSVTAKTLNNGPAPTPEPATLLLTGLGLAGLGAIKRRRNKTA